MMKKRSAEMPRTDWARAWVWGRVLILGGIVLSLAACSGVNKSNTTATLQQVDVTPSLVNEGETAVVEVVVTNTDGQPLANQTVYLSAEPSTSGTFSSTAVQTDADGIASVIFTASTAGTVSITARVNGNQTTMSKEIVIETPTGGGSTSGHIVLSITPGLIQADGLSSAEVTAQVSDGQGHSVADGTVIKFTAGEKFYDANGDGVWTYGTDSLIYDINANNQWDPMGSIDQTVTTQTGRAVANYTAGNMAGVVYIKATGGDPSNHYWAEVSLNLTSSDSVNSIALTPNWQTVQVRGTGGIEHAVITAQTFDSYGNPAPQGREIDFLITAGPGGGEGLNGDPIGPVKVLTDANGVAKVTFNSGNTSGTVRIVARSGAVVSGATQITIRSGPPAFISVGASDCNVPSWEVVNELNDIVAVVNDQWGNEVPDSTAIWFGTEQGTIEGAGSTSPTLTFRGTAKTEWHSSAPKNDGLVYYWASTAGGTVADTSAFFESGPAASGAFLSWPDTLLADGTDKGEVVIRVLDVNGVFMDTDTPIDVDADIGSINNGLIEDGCHSSVYVQNYVASTLDRDYMVTIPDSGIGGIATIKARCGGLYGFNGSVQVVLRTGAAYSKTSLIDMPTSMVYGTSSPIEVTIKDRWGNPLGGHLVTVSGDGTTATITGSPQYTNSYGVASGFDMTVTSNQNYTESMIIIRDLDPNFGNISIVKKVSLQQ
jgi:hypothetical protein